MINSFLNITVIAEIIAFVAACLLLDRKTTYWQIFIIFLLLTLCTEMAGWLLYHKYHVRHNALPFNIFMVISITFLILFFTKAKPFQRLKRLLAGTAIVFFCVALVNLVWFQGYEYYNSLSESFGDIILSVISCYFLFTLVKAPEYIDLLKLDYFWLANGILIYSMGSALLYQFSHQLRDFYVESHIDIGTYINYALNLIFYTSLIIAFVCRRKSTR